METPILLLSEYAKLFVCMHVLYNMHIHSGENDLMSIVTI